MVTGNFYGSNIFGEALKRICNFVKYWICEYFITMYLPFLFFRWLKKQQSDNEEFQYLSDDFSNKVFFCLGDMDLRRDTG